MISYPMPPQVIVEHDDHVYLTLRHIDPGEWYVWKRPELTLWIAERRILARRCELKILKVPQFPATTNQWAQLAYRAYGEKFVAKDYVDMDVWEDVIASPDTYFALMLI